jgi:nucleotide-binding universal stress UspA family protein
MMNLLYATDGSESALAAGRVLAALPLPAGTRVTVLSAIPEHNWLDTPLLAEVMADEEAAALRTAEAATAALQGGGREVQVRVRSQNPAAAILEEAQEAGTDLIVVGSHGKGAVQRFLIGSVSERVARYAPCSVLVVRGVTPEEAAPPRRVLAAVDGQEASEHALEVLARLPLPAEAELRVIHALHLGSTALPSPLVPGLLAASMIERYDQEYRALGERIVRHARELLDHAGRAATTELRWGPVASEIVAAAQEWQADLIAVGAANRSALSRFLLGSVSIGVLHHAPCSVLVARTAHVGESPPR